MDFSMRESWDDHFFKLAQLTSTRSTCLKMQYGAILVKDKHYVSGGFNGAPRGCEHCIICARQSMAHGEHPELCRATHAEQNAIANAAKYGISVADTHLYLWPRNLPCILCAKILINAGISTIHVHKVRLDDDPLSLQLLKEASIMIVEHI